MNFAILRKLTRDALPLFLITFGGVLTLEILIVGVFNELAADLQQVLLSTAFIRRFITTILGAEIGDGLSPTGMLAFGFAHPVLYALSWAFLLATITRVLVSEIELGTADLLLTLPVSRFYIYASTAVVWLIAAVFLSLAPLVGTRLGVSFFGPNQDADFARLAVVSVNLFALNVCIGAVAMLISTWVSRRGMAIGIVLAFLLSSFLLNFLATLSQTARSVSGIGVLYYYRPLVVVRDSGWPIRDIIVLLLAGLVCWAIGAWRYSTKDIHAA